MKRNYVIGFAVSAAALALLAFAAWSLFETFPRTRYLPPSREARVNEYLALDRWLGEQGIGVRIENQGDLRMISQANERHIFIQASLFRWSFDAVEYLVQWVEEGGTLFLVLDAYSELESYEIMFLLDEFGITADAGYPSYYDDPDFPDYDRRFFFEASSGVDASLKDRGGAIKLVQARRGRGKVIVSGEPHFLKFSSIGDAPNARLAWALFAADERKTDSLDEGLSENAWLFIRGTPRARGLLGDLFRQGNFPVLLVSVLVLIIIGFWAVIPLFGLVRSDTEKPGKPLRERFLAEALFMKKYDGLNFYLDIYMKEIRRRLAVIDGSSEDIKKRITEILAKPEEEELIANFLHGERINYRDFPGLQKNLKTILEKI
ncbi:MAG: DUF4350 domain-containing protein [Treponema sp.]|nr:DUF4350 domain-containing protein [Treponema sp.]